MMLFPPIRLNEVPSHRWSVAALVATNALPLVGVMFWGWRAFDVVFLYWLENVVIGAVNVLKMLVCWPDPEQLIERVRSAAPADYENDDKENADAYAKSLESLENYSGVAMQASKLFFVPFFTVHYGIFCLVHGTFVCVLLGEGGMHSPDPFAAATQVLGNRWLLLAAAGLAASHLVSFFSNFLARGEFRRTAPLLLMFMPYPRIIVLHVAIVLSGFLTAALGSPIWLLVLLVIGKTMLDLALHLHEHREPDNLDDRRLTTA